MPNFRYKAKMKNAETVLGHVDAQTREEAVEKINQMGLTAVLVEESGSSQASRDERVRPRKISSKEVYFFSRQLANLIKSGISILRTLELISAQIKNTYFKHVIETIYSEVKDGKSFSDSLSGYPLIFSNFYVTMVKAGEESGNLKGTLVDVASYLQEQEEIASKVRTAIAYPLFMGIFGLGTVVFILTYVMPKITSIFENFNQALPLPTQIVMAISAFLISSWYWVVIAAFVIIMLIKQWDKTKEGRLYKSQVQLSLPMFGSFMLKVELARFCRTLQMLLKSGIPIVRAIQLSTPVVESAVIAGELRQCQDDLLAGKSLGESLRDVKYVPPMLGDLIVTGEESGSLTTTLNDIADTYEQDTNEFIKLMTTLLEPAMILAVGSVIGMIVIAMLLPIFQLDVFAR
ncbi:MAG: type II secretion system F family protein [Candidatus Omnitrophica bacterium]|nr:type II secretion system F family protein [Candidatus Omnitrophota bacterium]